jgi:hypothetical protein
MHAMQFNATVDAVFELKKIAIFTNSHEKRLHLHEQSGDVFDRMQDFIDECGGVDDEGVKPFPDKQRDAMFAALLRKVRGSHRARFEAFTVALTKVGNFDGKTFEELKQCIPRRHKDGPNEVKMGIAQETKNVLHLHHKFQEGQTLFRKNENSSFLPFDGHTIEDT